MGIIVHITVRIRLNSYHKGLCLFMSEIISKALILVLFSSINTYTIIFTYDGIGMKLWSVSGKDCRKFNIKFIGNLVKETNRNISISAFIIKVRINRNIE